jgi:hypothetical protein
MVKNSGNNVIGSRVKSWKGKDIEQEVQDILIKKFNEGSFRSWFGAGSLTNHIALGLFTPLSICGRHLGEISSSSIRTPVGRMCGACKKTYEKAFLAWVADREQQASTDEDFAAEVKESLINVRELIKTHPDWSLELMDF